MILECRIQVSLRKVAGVACLSEEAEIRQFQVGDNTGYLNNDSGVRLPLKKGMGKHQAKEKDTCAKQGQANT